MKYLGIPVRLPILLLITVAIVAKNAAHVILTGKPCGTGVDWPAVWDALINGF